MMLRFFTCLLCALMLGALTSTPANASPRCVKDQQPYKLAGDSIEWSISIKPGADCIQGMRWSFMQIYAVWVLNQPKAGELVIVGSGFRYFAKPEFTGTDKFTLVVVGKNRHDAGYSTVEISVTHPDPAFQPGPAPIASAVSHVAAAQPQYDRSRTGRDSP